MQQKAGNKFSSQQQYLQYQQQQQFMQQQLARAQAAGMVMDDYGDEMDDMYYEEEFDESMDPQMLQQYYQQQQLAAHYGQGGFADSSSGGDALIAEGFEILKEELPEDYEPTQDEIEEYAKYLGMDMVKDRSLFYIAKEGLKAPLPGPWRPCKSPDGQIYYYNLQTKELQKEHPCDDYYKKYYVQEKALQARKKEEEVVKKHIKQQQKAQQQEIAAGISVGSAYSQQLMAQLGGKSATGQSAVLQQMMSPLDVSASAVDEIVGQRLDQIAQELEDQQIVYERKKREELKVLDQQKQRAIEKIKSEAQEELEYLKDKIRHEVQIASEGAKKQVNEKLRTQLKQAMQSRIEDAMKNNKSQVQQAKLEKESQLKKDLEKVSKFEQKDYDKEVQQIKLKTDDQILLQKNLIKKEIKQLADASGDVDSQIQILKSEMFGVKLKQEQKQLNDEQSKLMEEFKRKIALETQETMARIKKEAETKMLKEKQAIQNKANSSTPQGDLADQKLSLRQEADERLYQQKKLIERENRDKLKSLRQGFDSGLEKAKAELKVLLQTQYDRELEMLDHQLQDLQLQSKQKCEEQDEKMRYVFESQKDQIEAQMKQEWEREKKEFVIQDHTEGLTSVKQTITESRRKVYQQESKQRDLQRKVGQETEDTQHIRSDQRVKQRELEEISKNSSKDQDKQVEQLETEIKLKEDEFTKLKRKIKERREALARGDNVDKEPAGYQRSDQLLQKAQDMRFNYLQQEVDALKLQLKEIALRGKDEPTFQRSRYQTSTQPISDVYDYSHAEMLAGVDFDLPVTVKLIEKLNSDSVVLKQLLANIERNRIKWRRDLDSDALSLQRRLALQSVKDKLDSQAHSLQQDQAQLEDKILQAKRREQSLLQLKEKLIKHTDSRGNADLAKALLKECQLEFDRHLRIHDHEMGNGSRRRKNTTDVEKDIELKDFTAKWAEFVTASNKSETDNFRPMLGLDSYEAAPKPYRLWSHYDTSALWRQRSRLLVDHEISKIHQNRKQIRSFLHNQQGFLTSLKAGTCL